MKSISEPKGARHWSCDNRASTATHAITLGSTPDGRDYTPSRDSGSKSGKQRGQVNQGGAVEVAVSSGTVCRSEWNTTALQFGSGAVASMWCERGPEEIEVAVQGGTWRRMSQRLASSAATRAGRLPDNLGASLCRVVGV